MAARIGKLMEGYPKVTGPVADTVVHTSAEGLDAGAVWIPVDDGEIPGYAAKPQGVASCPIVLVIQEVFGCDDYLKDTCRRAAHAGLMAVAPELYARQGEPGSVETREEMMAIVASVPDAQVMSDLDAAGAWAAGNGGDATRLGCTGFCWGGRIVWLYAAHNPDLRAAVAWYGRLTGDTTERQPKHPLDVAAELHAPVLGLYGEADQGIPLTSVDAMRAALEAAKDPSKIHVYADAPHAFHADYRPSFVAGDAADGWQRMLEWLNRYAG